MRASNTCRWVRWPHTCRGHVVALPYTEASQSGVLQLAMAMGRAAVVTSVGGLPEVLEDGRGGAVVAPGDTPALARALAAILADPALAARYGRHNASLAGTRYAWDAIARDTVATYRALSVAYGRGIGSLGDGAPRDDTCDVAPAVICVLRG